MEFNTPNKALNPGQIFPRNVIPTFGEKLSASSKEFNPNDSNFDDVSEVTK